MNIGQANLEEGKKQPTPLDTKQNECVCIDEVEEDPNEKALKGSNARIQAHDAMGGERDNAVI